MRILLHICCGPCSLYPVKVLREQGHDISGYFYNPNIHPFREFERRAEALEQVSENLNLPVIWDESGYGLDIYMAKIGTELRPDKRCPVCYRIRLEKTAQTAARMGVPAVSTTLLYSRYQRHDLMKKMASDIAARYDLEFFYEDFRQGWVEGIEMSRSMGIYRQPYCGCIFSEQERYAKRAERMRKRLSNESPS